MTSKQAALCIGCNYVGSSLQLQGCVNDARMMRDILVERYGWEAGRIELLEDGAATKEAIMNRLRNLAALAKRGELSEIWVTYSGHGTQVKDLDGDEGDGKDEALVPVDHAVAGMITDDELFSDFTSQVPKGCNVVALFDCCHSGTMLDLTYAYYGKAKRSVGAWWGSWQLFVLERVPRRPNQRRSVF